MTQAGHDPRHRGVHGPEQARGKTVDKRADIWAFGCVLYEMLTGRRAFRGRRRCPTCSPQSSKREPDWRALPAETPASIRRLLRRCLAEGPQAPAPRHRRCADRDRRARQSRPQRAVPAAQAASRRRERLAWASAPGCSVALVAGGHRLWRSARRRRRARDARRDQHAADHRSRVAGDLARRADDCLRRHVRGPITSCGCARWIPVRRGR